MRILSGIQPTGEMHLGNYLGAFKQFTELQDNHETYFMIADLHALTEIHDAKRLRKMIAETKRAFLAFGLSPKKSTLFVQSEVPAHTELAWILATLTPLGELERMTQFKDKRAQSSQANAGLFTYPVLMAADILLYRAQAVPVGEDQIQHLELARTLARRFNKQYGSTFYEPKPMLAKDTARIMSLQDPTKKMSKSLGEKHYVGIFENERSIRDKFKRAITDSETVIKYDPARKAGVSNLLRIYAGITNQSIIETERHFANKSYAQLKQETADSVVSHIKPIQERYKKLTEKETKKTFAQGTQKTCKESAAQMKKIKEKIGIV